MLRALPSQMRSCADVAAEGPPVKLYMDPALCRSRRRYQQFLGELQSRQMVRWCRTDATGESNVGCFFVHKRDGRQRVIFDTRVANLQWRPPPTTGFELGRFCGRRRVHGGASLFRHD